MSEPVENEGAEAFAGRVLAPDAADWPRNVVNLARAYLALRLLPTGFVHGVEREFSTEPSPETGSRVLDVGSVPVTHEQLGLLPTGAAGEPEFGPITDAELDAARVVLPTPAREPVAGPNLTEVAPTWVIVFEDQSVRPVFYRGTEADARAVLAHYEERWACHLYVSATCIPHPPSGRVTVTEAMALAAAREFAGQRGESFDAMWDQLGDRDQDEFVSEWTDIIRAALNRSEP